MRRDNSSIVFENQYIRWEHDSASGELTGAFVKFGSGRNLLKSNLTTSIVLYDYEKCCPVALKRLNTLEISAGDNGVKSRYLAGGEFLEKLGVTEPVEICHEIRYNDWGIGEHTVNISARQPIPNLFSFQVISVTLASHFDVMTWRPTLEAGVGIWAQNNTPEWRELYGGNRQSDMQALNLKRLPLSFMAIQRGVDGIEFSLGDDLEEWNVCRPDNMQSSQEFQFAFDHSQQGYRLFVAPYNLREDGVLSGSHTFHFQLALPMVKEKMAPLRLGAQIPYGPGSGRAFEERWPTADELKEMAVSGYEMLRVHNDGDSFHNGIFWRDAAYPPYPADEMAKMAKCLDDLHSCGLKAMPYFSLKEIHPDVADFNTRGKEWGRLDEPGGALRYTRYPGGFWGVIMCLKSGWYKKRMDTIREVLQKHPFDGIYFDWCMALECFNRTHCQQWHWDNSEFTKLLLEVRELCGKDEEIYLHTSNVPSLLSENLATTILTEEVAFSTVNPEMFTPHVHFLNTAPRQICNMLPRETGEADRKRLAMCALLHHATVADASPVFRDFYRQNRKWMDTVTKYKKHHAPGERWGGVNSNTAGMAYYENDDEILLVFANLAEEEQTVTWNITDKKMHGTITLPPMQITVEKR